MGVIALWLLSLNFALFFPLATSAIVLGLLSGALLCKKIVGMQPMDRIEIKPLSHLSGLQFFHGASLAIVAKSAIYDGVGDKK